MFDMFVNLCIIEYTSVAFSLHVTDPGLPCHSLRDLWLVFFKFDLIGFHFICLLPVSLVVRLGFRLFLTRVLICYQQTINQGVYANFQARFLISLFPLTTIR